MYPPMNMPAPEINDEIESMGKPITKEVVQVPGAKVMPMPIKIPPIMALGISFIWGVFKLNSLEKTAPKKAPTITPILTRKANKRALLGPSLPIIGKKLLPPIQNFLILKYIMTLRVLKRMIIIMLLLKSCLNMLNLNFYLWLFPSRKLFF